MIPFNKPYLTGREEEYIKEVFHSGKLSGNGKFTYLCQKALKERYGFGKCLLTTSGTDALEMAAILLNLEDGDEVIVPSFTFVSTANPFILHGAKVVFADCSSENPNIDPDKIEDMISDKTRAIVVMHYAGLACEMDKIMTLAKKYNLIVIEDAALALDSCYFDKPLGSIGDIAAFSFHETKNIISGEGGMLVLNNPDFFNRAEIIWEKGTNRAAFSRGETSIYGWKDIGSSFLPSEMIAAFLYAQIEQIENIQKDRLSLWEDYYAELLPLQDLGKIVLPFIEENKKQNASLFYFLTENRQTRDNLLNFYKENGIQAVFHYLPLHESEYFMNMHDGRELPFCNSYSDRLIRLPFYCKMENTDFDYICLKTKVFFEK